MDDEFERWFQSVYTEPVPQFYKTIARMAWDAGYDYAFIEYDERDGLVEYPPAYIQED